MAFTVPTFPILCNIYTGPWLSKVLRLANVPCNLAWGRRIADHTTFYIPDPSGNAANSLIELLVAKLTDVRYFPLNPVGDIIECPAGSGRWYATVFVDDIGKGFTNEHRGIAMAQISQTVDATLYAGCMWPIPMP